MTSAGSAAGSPRRDEPQRDEPQRDEPQRDEPRRDEPRRDEPRPDEPWLIKRYANRKLYDTVERRFTSLSRIRTLVRDGVDVLVIDHDSGEDRTAETLSQSLGRRRRGVDTDDMPGLGLLSDLIRAPGKLARAVSDNDRGVEEIRDLRREVQVLAETLDKLLESKLGGDDATRGPSQ